MDIKELNKRLETLINEFDDNIEDMPKIIYVTPIFPKPIDYAMMVRGRVEKQIYIKVLNEEKFEEWKELFNAYKELKDEYNAESFTKKFKDFTDKRKLSLFTIDIHIRPKYCKEWRELHKTETL